MTMTRKKLIEVALPLEAINVACAREKSIRHGHPSTLHLWWARRPLAAARAVIFSQMVDDPSSWPDLFPTAKAQEKERKRLFKIIEELVMWESTTNEKVLQAARDEIWDSWRRACTDNVDHPQARELFDRTVLPGFHDPFAGGGALPLEAQRLGLRSHASDLNPVAVMINKSMIEIPSRFAGKPPINPSWYGKTNAQKAMTTAWGGAQGLAEDVGYYGQWMREEAEKKIGDLYPKIEVTAKMIEERPDLKPYAGQKLTVIAWIWARTVKSPNPAFKNVDVPLASSFILSSRAGKEAYVVPVIEGSGYRFTVRAGKPKNEASVKNGTKVGRGGNFQCLLSATPIPVANIREQGLAGTLGSRLMAIVAEGPRGRIYLSPTSEQEEAAQRASPTWFPETEINHNPRDIRTQLYGLTKYGDLFTARQLVALTTLTDLVTDAIDRIKRDALKAGLSDDNLPLAVHGTGATAYAEAVGVYLAFSIDKAADYWSTVCTWHSSKELIRNTFGRQAIPMSWDFVETNIFSESTGNVSSGIDWAQKAICAFPAGTYGLAEQSDAQTQEISKGKVVSTDPPYYDNIGYADLSDFFYVWLRRSLRSVFPNLFATMAVPKAEELVATPYRHGSKEKAEIFFLGGMTDAMHRLAGQAHPAFPVTIYYAFKQSETDSDDGTTNTGWDTFLAAVIEAGFAISGTWPMRTELTNRMIGSGTNALASSIVLVCRPRSDKAPTATRRDFLNALKAELPSALAHLQAGNIAPVDLAQAAIGPGMAVYTRFAKVLDAEGKQLSVRAALALINQVLDEALAEQEGDFDADTRWALAWFEQVGFDEGEFGVATVLANAKNTGMNGLAEAGIVRSGRGKVQLLKPSELTEAWDPETDQRLTAWETVHRLIQAQNTNGEPGAAAIVAKLGVKAETSRELCYRLYTLCERKKRSTDAIPYNALVQSWPEIVRLAQQIPQSAGPAGDLFSQE
jgi:putative DNA methylase